MDSENLKLLFTNMLDFYDIANKVGVNLNNVHELWGDRSITAAQAIKQLDREINAQRTT